MQAAQGLTDCCGVKMDLRQDTTSTVAAAAVVVVVDVSNEEEAQGTKNKEGGRLIGVLPPVRGTSVAKPPLTVAPPTATPPAAVVVVSSRSSGGREGSDAYAIAGATTTGLHGNNLQPGPAYNSNNSRIGRVAPSSLLPQFGDGTAEQPGGRLECCGVSISFCKLSQVALALLVAFLLAATVLAGFF